MERILLVEDNTLDTKLICGALKDKYNVVCATTLREAVNAAATDVFAMALVDYSMPDGNGFDLLTQLRESDPDIPVVLVTAHAEVELVVRAMRPGAHDYVTKDPGYADRVRLAVDRLYEKVMTDRRLATTEACAAGHRARAEIADHITRRRGHAALVGESSEMEAIRRLIGKAARSNLDVLVLGETGTGKELVARAIHDAAQPDGSFVAINCGAIPDSLTSSELFGFEKGAFTGAHAARRGVFEQAARGTLLLDEIGSMPLEQQAILLRVLQERSFRRVGGTRDLDYTGRTISATHIDLPAAIDAGRFRQDLFYRLNTVTIEVPALRDRRGDIPVLARHFLALYNTAMGVEFDSLSDRANNLLTEAQFPGNVRQLEGYICAAIAQSDADHGVLDLPEGIAQELAADSQGEAGRIHAALERMPDKTMDEIAGSLGMSRSTLWRKMDKYGIIRR